MAQIYADEVRFLICVNLRHLRTKNQPTKKPGIAPRLFEFFGRVTYGASKRKNFFVPLGGLV
jgi:hypothetical protein